MMDVNYLTFQSTGQVNTAVGRIVLNRVMDDSGFSQSPESIETG